VTDLHRVRDAEGTYARSTLLAPDCLAAIAKANLAFIDLLRTRAACPQPSTYGISAKTLNRLAQLPRAQQVTLADCPYALFDFAYADGRLWRTLTQRPAVAGLMPDDATSKFVRMAVFLTWHLSRSSDEPATLGLGMAPDVLRIWRGVELDDLEHIAGGASAALTARFASHGPFWDRLIMSAITREMSPSSSIRLLGLQLLAASHLSS
jgi:hypothetical protein